MQGDPWNINRNKFVASSRRVIRLGAFRSRLDDLAGSAHADAIIRRQVHLIVVAAPESWQDEAAHFVRHLKLLPLARLAFVM